VLETRFCSFLLRRAPFAGCLRALVLLRDTELAQQPALLDDPLLLTPPRKSEPRSLGRIEGQSRSMAV